MINRSEIYSLPEADLPVHLLEKCLSRRYLTNSYKLYWFLGLLEIIQSEEVRKRNRVFFRDVVHRMIAKSWYTLLEFRLNFGVADQLQNVICEIYKSGDIEKNIPERMLLKKLRQIKNGRITYLLEKLSRYVPYRFLSPFFPEFQGINDHLRNRNIAEASRSREEIPYRINNDDESLTFLPHWLFYFYQNLPVLTGWARYKLIDFLQRRNPNVPGISFKLDVPVDRNMNSRRKYWIKYIEENRVHDIYTDDLLRLDNLSIDHFVPWKFVMHDLVWNLIPTTNRVNSSKNDRLPDWKVFFPGFVQFQYNSLSWYKKNYPKNMVLEDYLLVNSSILNWDCTEKQFENYLETALHPLHMLAKNQGFEFWNPNIALQK